MLGEGTETGCDYARAAASNIVLRQNGTAQFYEKQSGIGRFVAM
jgi:hypothetical protein